MEDNIVNWVEIIIDGSGYGNGKGYGNGYGSGHGCGSGYGRGYGNGDGYGDGNGYGNGDGYGDGDGYGRGYGNGYGYGYGNGYGQGDGYGKGISEFNGCKVYDIDGIPTIIYSLNRKAGIASGAIIERNSRLKPCFIAKRGGCFAHGEYIHKAVRDVEAKYMQRKPLNERIDDFMNEFGDCDRIPASELFKWHNVLTGSCEFGRKQFCEEHNINLETDSFTIPEFIMLVENEYGKESIKKLKEKYYHDRRKNQCKLSFFHKISGKIRMLFRRNVQ